MASGTVVTQALRVRAARPEDASAILSLLAGVGRDSPLAALDAVSDDPAPFALALGRMGDQGLVALAEDVAGAALLGVIFVARGPGPARHTATLSVAVDPAARRHGAGRALVRAALEWARERSLTRLVASVASGNGAALALFGACGFAVEGRRPGHLYLAGRFYDEVLFGLGLGAGRAGRPGEPRGAVRR